MKLRIVRMCGGRVGPSDLRYDAESRRFVRYGWRVTVPRLVPGWGVVWDVAGRALVWGDLA